MTVCENCGKEKWIWIYVEKTADGKMYLAKCTCDYCGLVLKKGYYMYPTAKIKKSVLY